MCCAWPDGDLKFMWIQGSVRLRAVSREEHLQKTAWPQRKLCGVVQLEDGCNFQDGPGHVRKVHAGPEV